MEKFKNIQEIRFLPNDKTTFSTYEDIKEFFTETMVSRCGKYFFPNKGMNCKESTLVFFQYDGKLIAAAMLKSCVKNTCYDEKNVEYKGYFIFDMETMVIFNEPITSDEIRNIDPAFKAFSQSKRKMDMIYLDKILDLIKIKTEYNL